MAVVAELADEALLPTQAAAEDVRAGKLDHLGQEGGQFPVNHLQESRGGSGVNGKVGILLQSNVSDPGFD